MVKGANPLVMEVVIRFKRKGVINHEYVVRGSDVEAISYLPDGSLFAMEHVSLDEFVEIAKKIRDKQRRKGL